MKIIALTICFCCCLFATAQENNCAVADSIIFQNHINQLSDTPNIGDCVISIGRSFLNTPYVSQTLDKNTKEELVVNLTEVDCTTFVEYVLAAACTVQHGNKSFEQFKQELLRIRYRNGILSDYSSRLHYFSDWLYNSKQLEILSNLNLSAMQPYTKHINFMSTHSSSYPALKDNELMIGKIKDCEVQLNTHQSFYIPKNDVAHCEADFKNGDVIGITTNINGLDILHVGFIVFENNRAHLLHASSSHHKVIISNETLVDYLANHKTMTGIMIARPK